ncbi:MAG: NusG domain II-containing protein [Clostridiales bacterium]|nr:NusG domain II-containing protein [Clostridiales bacterium]
MHRNGSDSINRIRKNDILLLLIFLVIALVCGLWFFMGRQAGETVQITVDGEVVGTYSLYQDRTVDIDGVGGNNTLVISDGQADMTEADCPDKICVDHRSISNVGETIVCLPHKVVVEIISSGEDGTEAEYDIIAQ